MPIEQVGPDQGGEPATPLSLDKQSVRPGDVVRIRMTGPKGGIAYAGVVPLGPTAPEIREGPDRA